MGDPILVDESLEQLDPQTIHDRGARVVYGGIYATLFPEEPFERGAADAVVKGDGDVAWGQVLRNLDAGCAKRIYDGGKIGGDEFRAARWDLMQRDKIYVGLGATQPSPTQLLAEPRGPPGRKVFATFWTTSTKFCYISLLTLTPFG
jgi:radical SAM superfamily enzyme YgiQ (UPF0313 family)